MRPQLPQLTCLVQMNNQTFEKNYINVPIDSFSSTNSYSSTEPKIKQEVIPISNDIAGSSRQILSSTINPHIDLSRTNEHIEYISNDMDDDNIQGKYQNQINSFSFIWNYFLANSQFNNFLAVVNVYTTHLPDISSTLPTILIQDEVNALNNSTPSNDLTLHNHLSLPSDSYSLIGEDLIKHSFSDDSSSGDQSDVEIDL